MIQDFYQSDENGRILPGKKDCVSVRINGKKQNVQKRLILCNLRELYLHFKESKPDVNVGLSKFSSLRPKWCILAGSSGTHTVCVCLYHQNIKLMLEGTGMNVDYKDLLSLIACDLQKYDCMMGVCPDCSNTDMLQEFLQEELEDMEEDLSYKQWTSTDRSNLIDVVQNTEDFIETLLDKLVVLKKHHYTAKAQALFLKEQKENLKDTECIVLADFAENYSFVVQDESQGFHWTKSQATLHPFVVYFKENGKVIPKSLCVISDYLEHNTVVVHTFQKHLINQIKEKIPNIKKIIYFSDGASSQYKNRKNFSNLCNHKSDFNVDAEWNFFATAHGKNACDGVGGTTKRETARASLQRPYKQQILTPQQFFEFCDKNLSGIKYMFVGAEEVEQNERDLKKRFDECCAIPHARERHRFVPINKNIMRCYRTSASKTYEDIVITNTPLCTISELKKNDFIVCVYDNEWYPAEIQDINAEHNDVFVTFFSPPGPRTSFKKSSEQCWVPIANVLQKITPLQLSKSSARNTYQISSKLCDNISKLFNRYKQ